MGRGRWGGDLDLVIYSAALSKSITQRRGKLVRKGAIKARTNWEG